MAYRKSSDAGKRAAEIFSAASGHARERGKTPSLLLKLFRGQISLTLTFWLFCVSIPLLGDMLFTQLVFPHLEINDATGTAAIFVWGTLGLVYLMVVNIGLWRSAKSYAGRRSWAVLAQICAVLGMAGSIGYALMWYGTWMFLAGA